MMAAITALIAAPALRVVLLERLPRTGKKLLATGNGRCNYTNEAVTPGNYHGAGDPELAASVLGRFGAEDTKRFFGALGVVPRTEERGRVFPYSGAASSVADALRFECTRLAVELECGFDVREIKPAKGGFLLRDAGGKTLRADAVVLAAGGRASPSLGSDGSGFELAKMLGHTVGTLTPALVQLKTEGTECRALAGIKVRALVRAMNGANCVAEDFGELLFVDYGLSGPPIFQLSTRFASGECGAVEIDLCPDIGASELERMLTERRDALSHLECGEFFGGFLNKRVGNLIMRRCGVEKLSLAVEKLTGAQIAKFARTIKAITFNITGNGGWQNAQVTAGGVDTRELFPDTLMSRVCPGLFLCGELLDLYGDCGGYNLQWAWASGRAAGAGAAEWLAG